MTRPAPPPGVHPIQVVARRTGITPDSLRAWEKRYGAVAPQRTPTGRRVYSDDDVKRLLLLRRATLAGRSIGQVARLRTEELSTLVADDDRQSAASPIPAAARRGSSRASVPSPEELLAESLSAVERLDSAGLKATLSRAHVVLSGPALLDRLVIPLIQRVGECWREGSFRVAHEHLATAVVRTFLGKLWDVSALPAGAPTVIATTPSGQVHELGALIAAAVAAAEGWRALYLGPSTPAQEVAAAALQVQARVVALSVVYPSDDPHLRDELQSLRRHLPAETVLLVGGRAASACQDVITRAGAELVSDLDGFRLRLEQLLGEHLGGQP